MSIMTRLGVRSLILAIAETILFFIFTACYFTGPTWLYGRSQERKVAARDQVRSTAMEEPRSEALAAGKTQEEAETAAQAAADKVGPKIRAKSMPIWMWVILGVVYLLIVTVWWAPGSEKDDKTELIALSIVSATTLVAVGIVIEWQYEAVSDVAREFWNILTTGGSRTG